MKVLLDENVPHDLRLHVSDHQAFTAAYAGFGALGRFQQPSVLQSGLMERTEVHRQRRRPV